MNPHVNAVAGRLSLRTPQRRALEILDRVTEIVPPRKDADVAAALEVIRGEWPSVTDFEREFPSLCFALATGVGKTRLMGAFITYLHLAHGIENFFILAPNLTIYRKLITDFTPNTPKYVFRGIAEFSTSPPEIITGDDYESRARSLFDPIVRCRVNIFNISKINTEVRGGRSPRIKRLSEYIGESYFEYLAALPDLVLLMDESHRYRASAGVAAINELKPILGLELTATPYVEARGGPVRFRNVIQDYPLAAAMADGFVKEPAVVTRRNFVAAGMAAQELERLKLDDGIRLHETVKAELETYARESGRPIVKPFMLVIARDTTHARELLELVESDDFFDGRYRGRAIQVDSSRSGAEEEVMIDRLLKVEHADEPTEVVIHVNMLKEGWDVTNLYTIVPLRPAHARVLIEQSIGRGLRLPYGSRTGVAAVDRLNIVAHDRFQEIIDEANNPESPIRLQQVVLDAGDGDSRPVSIVSQPLLQTRLGIAPAQPTAPAAIGNLDHAPAFESPADQSVARVAYGVIHRMSRRTADLPSSGYLGKPEIRAAIVAAVNEELGPDQRQSAADAGDPAGEPADLPDVEAIVARTADLVAAHTIDIPRISVVPIGAVASGFRPFELSLDGLRLAPVSDELWIRHLRTGQVDVVGSDGGSSDLPAEHFVVEALAAYDDIAYDQQADQLYDLAGQVSRHLASYMQEDDVRKVMRFHQRDIARFVHAQMQEHAWAESEAHEVVVSRGFVPLAESGYTIAEGQPILDFRVRPEDRSNMARYLFGHFERCLYQLQKFDSDPERQLAVILDRESLRWFKPARGQFQIYYHNAGSRSEYQPDFVAELDDEILMLEPKARNELGAPDVQAKTSAAEEWCRHATDFAAQHGGKPWRYAVIPHDVIRENMSVLALSRLA